VTYGRRRENRCVAPRFRARIFSGGGKETPEQGIFTPRERQSLSPEQRPPLQVPSEGLGLCTTGREAPNFCSRVKLTGKNTGNKFDMGMSLWLAGANILGFTGIYRVLSTAKPMQITGNGIRDNRETVSNNRENRTLLSLYFPRYRWMCSARRWPGSETGDERFLFAPRQRDIGVQ
jgi:hypothetical protein